MGEDGNTAMPRNLYAKMVGENDPPGTWCCPACFEPLEYHDDDDDWLCQNDACKRGGVYWEDIERCH